MIQLRPRGGYVELPCSSYGQGEDIVSNYAPAAAKGEDIVRNYAPATAKEEDRVSNYAPAAATGRIL